MLEGHAKEAASVDDALNPDQVDQILTEAVAAIKLCISTAKRRTVEDAQVIGKNLNVIRDTFKGRADGWEEYVLTHCDIKPRMARIYMAAEKNIAASGAAKYAGWSLAKIARDGQVKHCPHCGQPI